MQVSRLEIKGFKSFGDKVVINFDEGITGIVGPNGCGKSNIVDAIRWVLGEQKTRNLRSDKMENVIFNGSKNRKPQQLAEVSITFNNTKGILPSAYSEVIVTRKYFRTGDSEYQLNGIPCRLKDINELFLDTGIGSDSYAIIELKMVDEILNDKENSRRLLFEEAAGISKFKVRKKQTLKKLEETDADLERLEDVLFEIAKNLKSLERQAKLCEKYFGLKEEHKTLSLEYARRNIAHHQTTLATLEGNLQQETELKKTLAEHLDALEEELAGHKTAANDLQEQLTAQQKVANEKTYNIRQLENEIKLKAERTNYLKERMGLLRQQISQDNMVLEQTQETIGQLQQDIILIQQEYVESEQQVSLLRQEIEQANAHKADLQKSSTDVINQQREKQHSLYQVRKDIEVTQVQVVNLTSELERLTAQKQNEAENADKYLADMAEQEEILLERRSELDALVEQENELQASIEQTETDLQVTRTNLTELNRKIDAKRNQYNLTKSLVDNLEGFPDAIKFLYKSKNWEKPAPLLSDIIVCQQEYKSLIESYLEPYMNFFVVDTTEDAVEAIKLLNNQNKGRANFIVLAELEDLDTGPTLSTTKLKAAYEVVSTSERYEKLRQYILNEVYISQELPSDFFSGDHRTFILRDGSVIKKPLSISGGSVGLFDGNRIGRKQNLDNLAQELDTLVKEAETLKIKINTQQQVIQNLKGETRQQVIKETERIISAQQQELMGIRIRHEQHALSQQTNHNKEAELTERLEDLRYKSYELVPQAEMLQQDLQRIESELSSYQDLLNRHNDLIQKVNQVFNEENIRYHQLKNRLTSVQQEINYRQKSLETGYLRQQAQQDELLRAEDEIIAAEEFVLDNTETLNQLLAERKLLSEELDKLEKDFFSLRGEIDSKDKTIREIQRKRQNADEVLISMQQAISDSKIKLVAIQERLAAEFNITEEDLAQLPSQPLEHSNEELSSQINSIKTRLDSMGPVNPMAAEAYEEISQRDKFIKEQKADLINAKNILLQTISEIDQVAKDKFLESFEMIKENFTRVFRSLFSDEDTCDLVIADMNNPLESKIEIMARPKGKRPLTINQLSGGEKTLTAISLLFAIYLLKPAPFCIFDEVDAPLDDANIDKFNNIVKTFSGDSQFIVVTHNKRTMASTDVIYGITMLEPGVSRVIPVDLRQLA
ncbi:chromosome segregation protein SMC [Adhaeribacter rhizoryzae]|uniref:Chromosome partition protein Smc n=1 Tax=Adhaeribacter rhizoryzae TaxID=2607907 RepID=A0A5M6DNW4_9BACT|nr:chromosome segregation protein SMC [Adhaeribacter rhizoryzae]KAA5547949.1 chromosome segregation protein SMC [Adhaeribacter rhizoryzae]